MKITFLGTGAADHCLENSEYRNNTSVLIDDVLIDGGSTVDPAMLDAGVDPASIHSLAYTHSHDDHYSSGVIKNLQDVFPKIKAIFASEVLSERIRKESEDLRTTNILQSVSPGEPVRVGAHTWEAYEANHATVVPPEVPFNYGISHKQHRVLMFSDTAMPYWRTVELLKRGKAAQVLIMDATTGMRDDDWRMFEHCSIPQVARVASCWRDLGVLRRDALVFCTHLSQTLLASQPPDAEDLKGLNVRLAPEGGHLLLDGANWSLCGRDGEEISWGKFSDASDL